MKEEITPRVLALDFDIDRETFASLGDDGVSGPHHGKKLKTSIIVNVKPLRLSLSCIEH